MRTLALLLLCVAAGCTYVEATTTQYVGVQRFPPVDPSKVQVLAKEPSQRHDRLGEVLLDISLDPAPPAADIEEKLRREAAKWGANAVYVVRDSITPREHKLIGIAIRYRQ
jgi:hypothetical protein